MAVGSSMGALIFEDNFNTATGKATPVLDATKGWIVDTPLYAATSGGIDGTAHLFTRKGGAEQLRKNMDVTTAVAGTEKWLILSFMGYTDAYEDGEVGSVDYTLDDGANWINAATFDNTVVGPWQPLTGFALDTTTWTATEKAQFGFRFGANGNLFTEHLRIDDVALNTSTIPEPATLGLIAAMGGGILFIRRCFFMI